jgi:hypothetical protein
MNATEQAHIGAALELVQLGADITATAAVCIPSYRAADGSCLLSFASNSSRLLDRDVRHILRARRMERLHSTK